jgi:hypothetical protein
MSQQGRSGFEHAWERSRRLDTAGSGLDSIADPSPALAWLGDGTAPHLPQSTRVALALLSWWGRGARLGRADRERLWQAGAPCLDALAERCIDSLLYWASEIDAPAQRIYDRVHAAQRTGAIRVLAALTGAGVDTLVCKGAELVPRLAGDRALHAANDTDLLVDRGQLDRARRVLHELGYVQAGLDGATCGLVDLDPRVIASAERGHYELFPFRALVDLEVTAEERAAARELCRGPLWERIWVTDDERTVLALEVDLHFRLAHRWDVDRLFARAVPSCLGVGRTLCTTDHVWFLALRYYNELAEADHRSLRPLALLVRLLSAPDIDWGLAQRVVVALHHAPALYYVLSLLERLAPGHVPPAVLAALDPAIVDRRNDHGWRLARCLGFVDPFPLEPARR